MPVTGYVVHELNKTTFALEEKSPMSQGRLAAKYGKVLIMIPEN